MSQVTRTGFSTSKGSLVLSILFPKPSTFKFVSQSFKFIGLLFCVALCGFALTVWQLYTNFYVGVGPIVIRALDLITVR